MNTITLYALLALAMIYLGVIEFRRGYGAGSLASGFGQMIAGVVLVVLGALLAIAAAAKGFG